MANAIWVSETNRGDDITSKSGAMSYDAHKEQHERLLNAHHRNQLQQVKETSSVAIRKIENQLRDSVLRFASPVLRGDMEVVKEAVRHDGGALRFASDEMRANKEVVMHALQSSSRKPRQGSGCNVSEEEEDHWSIAGDDTETKAGGARGGGGAEP